MTRQALSAQLSGWLSVEAPSNGLALKLEILYKEQALQLRLRIDLPRAIIVTFDIDDWPNATYLHRAHEGAGSSDEEFSGIENEGQEAQTSEDRELKERLLHKYGSHISSLKLEFSKKKKKGKLPKEARQTLLEWWNLHYQWPYPTYWFRFFFWGLFTIQEADKISLAESTGLDQKQINNWFINQRKRHWKPSENMRLAVMGNISGQLFTDD
ncbi:hypothetical protein RHSIM_Rhsim12G0113400 [Rhododendron simsii]|uniref:Uncharacterized protein n=1 Tax=Rhododendron simsii TaxID=118357 RepID=A0A834L9U2_RHOSS|nr:hypothetical protein RHSIM_Rhsim12G0113400 [Rhododendron simsii]